ncbi:annexin [Corallococcus sp. AB018]|uniref:annexin n=1 Tax=Corallococcus sp. AB018 TaxID=2316715 RepID=UPI000F874009|nr:hypothetical protein [Corallococcus sp. AB018]
MGSVKAVGGSGGAPKVDPAEAQRRAEEAQQKAEAARLAAEARRNAATEARDNLTQAKRDADGARRQKTAEEKSVTDARKAAERLGQTPAEAKKSKEALATAEKKLKEATNASLAAAQKLQDAEEKAALAAKSAEEAMLKANAAAVAECKTPPYSQKDIDKVKPTKSELESAFEGTSRKAQLEKLLGLTAPPPQEVIQSAGTGEAPGTPFSAKYTKDASPGPFGQTATDPSAATWFHQRPGANTGVVPPDVALGNPVPPMRDGSSRDTKVNGLDVAADWVAKATPTLRARSEMVFLKDSRPGAEGQSGHVLIRQGDRVMDPARGKNYDNLQAFLKDQPHYQPAGTLSANAAAKILSAPPGSPERQKAIAEAKVPDSLQRMLVTDSAPSTPQAQTPSQAPSYTQAQADRDAAALFDAMEGGATGWGTDEETVFKTLEGKSPEQIDLIRKGYKHTRGKDLDSVIRDELGGADGKHALALLQGDASKSAAVQVQAELDGVFGSNEDLLKVLEKQTPEQRQDTAQKFAEMNGGLKPGQSAQDFMLGKLGQSLNPEQLNRARNMLSAGQPQTPEQRDPLEAQAIKDGLKQDMDGLGTDEDRIFERLEKATPEQRRILAQDEVLKSQLKDELGQEDYDRAMGLLQDNPAKADAARLTSAMNGVFGADKSGVRAVLEGKKPDELAHLKAEYQKLTGKSLEDEIRKWGGADKEVTLRLLNPPQEGDTQAQAEANAEKLKLAVDGAGTDEDALRDVLQGKSKAEINDISAAYKRKYGEDLRSRLDSELSGRDHLELLDHSFDLGAVDDKDPNANQELARRLREQQANESGFGTWLLDNVQRTVKGGESDNDRLNRNLRDAEKAIQAGDTQNASRSVGFATDDVKSLQSSKDSLAEGAATAAVAVATTSAVVLSGGAATPLAIAGYAALGATTRAATNELIQGGAAGWEDAGRQAVIGAVEGGTAVLPVTKGASVVSTSAAKGVTTTVGKEAVENTVLTAAKQGVKEGVVGGAAGGAVDAATRSETWQNGLADGLGQVAVQAGTGAVLGGAAGGLTSAGLAKGLQPREIPVVRNPELAGSSVRVRYGDSRRVHIEAGPKATPAQIQAHLKTAQTLQKYEGPLGQVRQLRDRALQALTQKPGHGTQGFESQLEVKKLNGLITGLETMQRKIDARLHSLDSDAQVPTAAQRAAIERDLESLRTQLAEHEQQLSSLAPARGFVAADDGAPIKEETIAEEVQTRLKTLASTALKKIAGNMDFTADTTALSKSDPTDQALREIDETWRNTFTKSYTVARLNNGLSQRKATKQASTKADGAARQVADQFAIPPAKARADSIVDDPSKWKPLNANDQAALTDFRNGVRGAEAKRLAPKLNNLSKEELENFLQQEVNEHRAQSLPDTMLGPNMPQKAYLFGNDTLVRFKPNGDDRAPEPSYSVEVLTDGISVLRSLNQVLVNGVTKKLDQTSVAFKIGVKGQPVPKAPASVQSPYDGQINETQYREFNDQVARAGHLRTRT